MRRCQLDNNINYKKIDVYNDNEDIIISSSIIHSSVDRITLLGDDFELINHKTKVRLLGYLEDGVVLMNGRVTLSTNTQLNLEILELDIKKERRKFLKVRINFKANLLKSYSLGKSKKSMRINEVIRVRDISLGGIGFYSNNTYLKNQKLLIDLSHIRTNFIVEAIVLRKDFNNFRLGYRYRYGCSLINIQNEQQRILCEYVFKVQIETHKKLMKKDLD